MENRLFKRLIGIPYSLFAGGLIIIYMAVVMVVLFCGVQILRRNETKILLRLSHGFGSFIMFLSKTKLVVVGKENFSLIPKDRRVFIVSNHESYLDIPCVLSIAPYPVGFIAKRELGKIPLLGYWIKRSGGVLLDRKDMRKAKATLSDTVDKQSVDRAILIFPEGTRNREGTVAEFKQGSVRTAIDSDAVIIPVAQSGGRQKLEGNGWVVKRGEIHITVLPPIDTRDFGVAKKGELTNLLRDIVLSAHCRNKNI